MPSLTNFAPLPLSPERKKSVLVVDDDRTWLVALTRLLEREGFAVTQAASATAALRTIKDAKIDLIVSDLNMPRMDGLELRDAMLSNGSGPIPFIFVSGSLDEENRAAAQSLGVPHFLEKTGPIRDLTNLARTLAGETH